MKKFRFVKVTLFFLPAFAGAETVTDFQGLVNLLLSLLNSVIPLLIGAGVVSFLFGVVKYVAAGDSEESRTAGRNLMIYGLIGLFVMVSVWGLVSILTNTFFGGSFGIPKLK